MAVTWKNHFRIAFGGSLWGYEQWSCSLKMNDSGMAGDTARINFAKDQNLNVANAVKAWFTRTGGSGVSTAARLEWVKFNAIGPDGKYLSPISNVVNIVPTLTPSEVTIGKGPLPAQCAIVVTLLTGLRAGPASHGRVYLPANAQNVAADTGRIAQASRQAIAQGFRDLIVDLNDWPLLDPQGSAPDVATEASSGSRALGQPLSRVVTEVRVGDVFDTMQSRRRSLREAYTSVTV